MKFEGNRIIGFFYDLKILSYSHMYVIQVRLFFLNILLVYTYVMYTLHQIKNKTHVRPNTNDGRRPYHFSICSTYLSHWVL